MLIFLTVLAKLVRDLFVFFWMRDFSRTHLKIIAFENPLL